MSKNREEVKIFKQIVLLSLIFLCCFSVHADSLLKVEIAVYRIDDTLQHQQEHLPYNQILNRLNQRIATDLEYQFNYPSRAIESFKTKGISCLFPGSKLAYDLDKSVLESTPVHTAKAYFIGTSSFSSARIVDMNQPPLNIGYRRNNTYGGNIKKLAHHNLIPLNSGADIRELLERKRIDVYLGYLPDSLPIINAIPDKPLVYDDGALFYSQTDSFLCQNTPALRPLMQQINTEIQKMHDSGEIQNIIQAMQNVAPTQSFDNQ